MSSNQTINICTCSTESRRSSASSASATTSASTSSTKPVTELNTEMTPSAFVSQAPVHPLPAYARDFPKPADEIDIDKALNRKPGRWTFRGTVEAGINRQPRPFIEEYKAEARTEAYAAAKKELLESAGQMKATGPKK